MKYGEEIIEILQGEITLRKKSLIRPKETHKRIRKSKVGN